MFQRRPFYPFAKMLLSLMLLGLLLWPSRVQAVISFGNTVQAPDATNTNTSIWTHPIGVAATDKALYICIASRGTSDAGLHAQGFTITPAASGTLSLIRGDTRAGSGGAFFRTELWQLLGPPTPSVSISVTLTNAATWIAAQSLDVGDLNLVAPIEGHNGSNGLAPLTFSTTVTTVSAHAAVLDCANSRADSTMHVSGGQTERVARFIPFDTVGMSTREDVVTPGSVSMPWTSPDTADYAQSVIAIAPATTITPPPNTALLTWLAGNPADNITTYSLYRGLGTCGSSLTMTLYQPVGVATSYTDSNIPAGTLGSSYELTATNANGESPHSVRVCKNFVSTTNSAILTWTTPIIGEDVTAANLYRLLGACGSAGSPTLLIALGLTTTYTDATIPSTALGASYESAWVNSVGESAHSNRVCKSFSTDVLAPAAPGNIRVE